MANRSEEKLPGDHTLWHQNGVNVGGEPFVQLIMGTNVIAQMTPEEARDHGRAMIESAEAAEQDAFIYDWVMHKVGAGPVQAAGLIDDFRKFRLARTGKRSGMEVVPDAGGS